MQHSACFAGGMGGIGAKIFERNDEPLPMDAFGRIISIKLELCQKCSVLFPVAIPINANGMNRDGGEPQYQIISLRIIDSSRPMPSRSLAFLWVSTKSRIGGINSDQKQSSRFSSFTV